MTPETFAAYKTAQDPSARRRLQNEIIASEQKLVEGCARKMSRGDTEDLVQAGRIGVLKALEKFDPSKGPASQFHRLWSVYARQWIRDEMNRGVVDLRAAVRVPHKDGRNHALMTKERKRLAQAIEARTGRPATAEELSMSDQNLEECSKKILFVSCEEESEGPRGDGRRYKDVAIATEAQDTDVLLSKALLRASGCLTPVELRIVLARVVDEKGFPEIAKAEGGWGERWAATRFNEAMKKLRDALDVGPAM